ncbi:unnamed protein product [Umbelopsis vinacea]
MSNRTPLTSRPLDLTYFIYVATHIPISLFLDCQALYPAHLVPQPLANLNAYYVNTFKDPLISNVHNLPWFKSFVYCEALFQIPFFFWALGGLYHNKPIARAGLLAYGAHVATTVVPSLAEVAFGTTARITMTATERYTLIGVYLPYLLIPACMVVDSYFKLSSMLRSSSSKQKKN